jgi:hypothetical protein
MVVVAFVENFLNFVFDGINGILDLIFDFADEILGFAFGLIGFAFGFQFLVINQVSGGLLGFTDYFFSLTFYSVVASCTHGVVPFLSYLSSLLALYLLKGFSFGLAARGLPLQLHLLSRQFMCHYFFLAEIFYQAKLMMSRLATPCQTCHNAFWEKFSSL